MLKRIFRALFSPPQITRRRFTDPVLGLMEPEETGWTASVIRDGHSFQISIGGSDEPDSRSLAHAREILDKFAAFKKLVIDFIQLESADYPANVKAELAALEIDLLMLYWPEAPENGMIFFRGPADEVRLWHCDYIDRRPAYLACDT